MIPTYPRHPFAMAQQALTVQAATSGRFTLGVGPSHQVVIETMWGMSYEKPGAAHARVPVACCFPLLREGRVQFSGELYKVMGQADGPGDEAAARHHLRAGAA